MHWSVYRVDEWGGRTRLASFVFRLDALLFEKAMRAEWAGIGDKYAIEPE